MVTVNFSPSRDFADISRRCACSQSPKAATKGAARAWRAERRWPGETPGCRIRRHRLVDAAQAFGGDVGAAAVQDLFQFTSPVRPTIRHPNSRAALAQGFGQPIIAGVTVDLKDAIKAGEEGFGILPRATGGAKVADAGRVLAASRPVIAGQRPEVSGLGQAARTRKRVAMISMLPLKGLHTECT